LTLLLSEADVEAAFDMREAIDSLEQAFGALADGEAVNRPRSHTYTDRGDGRHHLFKTMDGAVAPLGVHALRLSSDLVTTERTRSITRRVKLPAAPGGRYVGLVLLFDLDSLAPTAIMPDGYLQRMRVGATSALAARHLARRESSTAAVIGVGWQAGAQVRGLDTDRSLHRIMVHGPTPARVEAFVSEHAGMVDAKLMAVGSAREAIEGADIVALSTNSMEPVLDGAWLTPGQHVGSVQGYELDQTTLRRADVIAVRSLDPSTYHHAPGRAPAEVAAEPEIDEVVRARMVELGDIVAGRAGRTDDAQITLFTGSHSGAGSGLGIQFAAVGHAVETNARSLGLGRDLPTEWFTQSGRP